MCCWCTQKSAFKSKDFFTLCAYPSLGKKDILSTLSELFYCHVGEGLADKPLQKDGQVKAHAVAVEPHGSDEKVMKIFKLTCSCR